MIDCLLIFAMSWLDGIAMWNLFSVIRNNMNQTSEPLKYKENKKVDIDYESGKRREKKNREQLTYEEVFIKIFGYRPSITEILFPIESNKMSRIKDF